MIYLNVHSYYSLLNGTISIESLIEKAKSLGISSIALTDDNAMYGLIKFYKQAKEAGIKSILGAQIDDLGDQKSKATVLAKNISGYRELCKIITLRKLNDDFSLEKVLNDFKENIIVISNSIPLLKELPNHNNLYAELITAKNFSSKNRELYNYCVEKDIPFIASNPIYFLNKDDYKLHKLVRAIDLNKAVDNLSVEEFGDEEFYFKNPKEIETLYKNLPQAIQNTINIANQCDVDLTIGEFKYPKFSNSGIESTEAMLTRLTYDALPSRYKVITDEIRKRLNYELEVINELSFTDYFLIVWEIVQESKRRGILSIGRGSAANSLVSYLLGFTQVDPIEHKLFFERFLNKARSSPPDVDLDFSWKERDEIVQFVFEKYGYDRVAMISTIVTFRARSAFRETAKAFGISDREISKYSKLIPWTNAGNLANLKEKFPESKNVNFSIEPWKTIVKYAVQLANFPRHLSIHPSGIVITPTKVTDYCALEYAKNKGLGLIITQPDMYSIEDLGLVKIDLLSQRSLGVLRDSITQIQKNYSGED